MSLALNELEQVALDADLNTTSEHAPQVERNYWYRIRNDRQKIIRDQLLMKSPTEFKDSSIDNKKAL